MDKPRNKRKLTHTLLINLLYYEPETGVFRIKKNRVGRGKVGDIVSVYSKSTTYYSCTLYGGQYLLHRLAWFYVYGEWPNKIDHINHNRLDNRISNLRNTDYTGNSRNKKLYSINKTGFNGVSWVERLKKYQARIKIKGIGINLGFYVDIKDAIEARKSANVKYGFHALHGKRDVEVYGGA